MAKLRLHLQPQPLTASSASAEDRKSPERIYVQRLVKAAIRTNHEEPGVFAADSKCLKFMNARELQDVSIWVHTNARSGHLFRNVPVQFDQSVSKLEFHLHSRRGETYRFSFSPDRLPSTSQGKHCFEIPGLVRIEIGNGDQLTRTRSGNRKVA